MKLSLTVKVPSKSKAAIGRRGPAGPAGSGALRDAVVIEGFQAFGPRRRDATTLACVLPQDSHLGILDDPPPPFADTNCRYRHRRLVIGARIGECQGLDNLRRVSCIDGADHAFGAGGLVMGQGRLESEKRS